MTTRWTFTEVATTATYTVPINPDAMSSPTQERQASTAFGISGGRVRPRTLMSPPQAKEWEFSGAIRTQEHHDALLEWSRKDGLVRVTDHLGRVFEVMFTSFQPTERQPTRSTPWRLRYTMKALLLRRIS